MLEIAHAIADACAQNGGPIVPFMGTDEFTLDLEMLRVALAEGDAQLADVLLWNAGRRAGVDRQEQG